ncbi:MAG TPA: helix-turn-helix transcriptional regulator [Acidimicrobiia bacterium]|nr:helix-turn-helix transcriptional regulator [Acidimicrobiia bacterium]
MERIRALTRIRRLCASGAARSIRVGAGLSLGALADHLGVQRSTVYRWETGQRRPQEDRAIEYLKVLDEIAKGS